MKKKIYYLLSAFGAFTMVGVFSLSVMKHSELDLEKSNKNKQSDPAATSIILREEQFSDVNAKLLRIVKSKFPDVIDLHSGTRFLNVNDPEDVDEFLQEIEILFRELNPRAVDWQRRAYALLKNPYATRILQSSPTPERIIRCLGNCFSYASFMHPNICVETDDTFYAWHFGYLGQGSIIKKDGWLQYGWSLKETNLQKPRINDDPDLLLYARSFSCRVVQDGRRE